MKKSIIDNLSTLLPITISICSAIWTFFIWKRQKHMEDKFTRSLAAYDIVLHKEFAFYEKSDAIYAQLIPCVHDIIDNLTNDPHPIEFNLSDRKKIAKSNFVMFCEKTLELKNITLQYEIYLPEKMRDATSISVGAMQGSVKTIDDELKKLHSDRVGEINLQKCREVKDLLLLSFATVRGFMITRLRELTRT
ncbi:hypothetical protein AGMMS50267_02250 [Spirochaetia bacterium]|nr:hypothetical protein AGMMS50267_02250 [Spirochaetia bacterium]